MGYSYYQYLEVHIRPQMALLYVPIRTAWPAGKSSAEAADRNSIFFLPRTAAYSGIVSPTPRNRGAK